MSLSRLVASIAFGALWTLAGIQVALAVFAGGLVVAMLLAGLALRSTRA